MYLFIALAVIGHSRCPHVMVIISLRPEESRFHLAATWLDQAALAAVSVCFCISSPTAGCIPLGGSCLELSDLCPCQGPGYIGDTGTVPTFRKQKAPEACPCAPAETQQIQEILEAIRTSHVRPFRLRCRYVTDVRPFPYGQCETLGFISWKMLKVATSIEFHGDGRKIQMVWILDWTT